MRFWAPLILFSFHCYCDVLCQQNYKNALYDYDGRADWMASVLPVGANYLAFGWTSTPGNRDKGIMLLDQEGNLISWDVTININFSEETKEAVFIDSNRIAIAIRYADIQTNDLQFKLEVIDKNGNHLWERIHGDPNIVEPPQAITYSNGRIVMTGSRTINGDQDIYIVAWDTAGNFLWDRAIGSPTNNENSYTIVPMDDGGYMVGGYRTHLDHTSYPSQKFRWFIARIDSSGIPMWQRTLGGTQGKGYCLDLLPADDGTVYGIGFKQVSGHPNVEAWRGQLMKLDMFGNVLFDSLYQYQGYREQALRGGIMLHNGDMVLIGELENDNTGKDYAWLLKVDSEGNQIWSRKLLYSETHHNYLRDIIQSPDGGFLMVGSVLVSPNDAWVVKVDSMGCLEPGCHLGTGTGPQYTGPAVQLYPNPVQHTLTIALPEGVHQASVNIFGISGQVVYTSPNISGTQTLSTIGWSPGLYLVQVATEAGLWHGKVVKVE